MSIDWTGHWKDLFCINLDRFILKHLYKYTLQCFTIVVLPIVYTERKQDSCKFILWRTYDALLLIKLHNSLKIHGSSFHKLEHLLFALKDFNILVYQFNSTTRMNLKKVVLLLWTIVLQAMHPKIKYELMSFCVEVYRRGNSHMVEGWSAVSEREKERERAQ